LRRRSWARLSLNGKLIKRRSFTLPVTQKKISQLGYEKKIIKIVVRVSLIPLLTGIGKALGFQMLSQALLDFLIVRERKAWLSI
jgi:hypothetical protein